MPGLSRGVGAEDDLDGSDLKLPPPHCGVRALLGTTFPYSTFKLRLLGILSLGDSEKVPSQPLAPPPGNLHQYRSPGPGLHDTVRPYQGFIFEPLR